MGSAKNSRPARRTWLAGRIAILLAIVVAGVGAIVHYSSIGSVLAASPHQPSANGRPHAATAVRAAGPAAGPARRARPTRKAGKAHGNSAAPDILAAAPSPSASGSPSPAPSVPPAHGAPVHFRTIPPGARLPSGASCAKWVRARPKPENKGVNRRFNRRTGQHVASNFLQGDRPAADRRIVPRINGRFTGTTKEILRWAACKWGINQNVVFAQAAIESWWRQTTKGDWGTDRTACPPGHRHLGAQGQCAQSYGILQNRYPFEKSSWPGIGRSTAMNADTAYAIWRACYDGYETWLNTVERGSQYHKGDVWGCVGRWFAGRWRTAPALQYIAKVKQYKRERIWETPDFQQP
jgi:autotransporter family porin